MKVFLWLVLLSTAFQGLTAQSSEQLLQLSSAEQSLSEGVPLTKEQVIQLNTLTELAQAQLNNSLAVRAQMGLTLSTLITTPQSPDTEAISPPVLNKRDTEWEAFLNQTSWTALTLSAVGAATILGSVTLALEARINGKNSDMAYYSAYAGVGVFLISTLTYLWAESQL